MRFTSITLLFILCFIRANGQVSYTGTLNTDTIEIATEIYGNGEARACFEYAKSHEPKLLAGTQKNKLLTLFEKDKTGKYTSKFLLNDFDKKSEQLTGIWTNLKTRMEYKVTLNREFDFEEDSTIEIGKNWEILQSVALKNYYLKLIITKATFVAGPIVSGIKILNKKTGEVIQVMNLDCDLDGEGIESISVGDYNFDGNPDFSVFKERYVTGEISREYFLFNPETKSFINSGFKGVDLEFNYKTKTIFEHKSSCMGTIVTNSTYKVIQNKMVLLEQHCYNYDNEKQKLVEHPLMDCD